MRSFDVHSFTSTAQLWISKASHESNDWLKSFAKEISSYFQLDKETFPELPKKPSNCRYKNTYLNALHKCDLA